MVGDSRSRTPTILSLVGAVQSLGRDIFTTSDDRRTAQAKPDAQHKLNLLLSHGHRPGKNWTTGNSW
jgi:hypothetical protein